jgi:excinuclease ABC subunit B
VRVRYMHSDIDAIERVEIIRGLRLGEFDVLVGINLLREGLDMPEVSLVAILDADQEGFLRSDRSLIQTIGRAARHLNGKAILYADRVTGSMQRAIDETTRRRTIQREYNEAHGIVPTGVVKSIEEVRFITRVADARMEKDGGVAPAPRKIGGESTSRTREELMVLVGELETAMREAAIALDFEAAARLLRLVTECRPHLEQLIAQARGGELVPKRPPGSAPLRGAGGATGGKAGSGRRGGGRRGR